MADIAVQATPAEASRKKFGMFLGVFTPSILTILGVIMYQRFGWVVGNVGLYGAIGVVALAHVISVTTGLSVSSIATNHKVGTGGNYYIISRSLGLSIGGAIGIALYAALTLGVSLYLIGFAEAVIAATGWSPTGNFANDLRVVGTLALFVLAVITLFSTDIAIKSQTIVLTFIILSLISIFVGSPATPKVGATAVGSWAPESGRSFAEVFAVFFPAVTGFTAGVGMSGDLKDPKRAIPIGTIAAIATGLLIYLILPVFIARHASVEDLQKNNNILLEIARFPWLVTAGVAAATISSALGSILGAPRTLQALAFDGIVPRFLGRGREEPRIALVVTIIIAQAGILIGELEVIGGVLSMFFLTCYGVLNLACGLETWASPDFRPQFRVWTPISLIGAAACFLVMFQISPGAMFASVAVTGAIYLYLKRRQLVLGSGDTWGGVWSMVVRTGLIKLRQTNAIATQHNWRPNMILMSRRGHQRREMIAFGRNVVGDRGILTHFDLSVGVTGRAKVDQVLENEYPGMFARIQGCENPFTTIPDIAANFGFVGMETNTILLGWPRDAGHNEPYAAMIARLVDLDLSVLMLRLDRQREFGNRDRIDIWWDGKAPTGPLMLTLAHLLTSSPGWKNARVRVMVNGQRSVDEAVAKKRLKEIVAHARIKAEPVLLPPLGDDQPFAERIRTESTHADLVMVHAHEPDEVGDFVPVNDQLVQFLGTALLVRPSSAFSDAAVVFDTSATEVEEEPEEVEVSERRDSIELATPDTPELATLVIKLEKELTDSVERFQKSVQDPSIDEELKFIRDVVGEVEAIHQLERRLLRRGARRQAARGLIDWAKNRFSSAVIEHTKTFTAANSTKKIEGVEEVQFETAWERRFREGLGRLRMDLMDIVQDIPPHVAVPTLETDWLPQEGDDFATKVAKLRVRTSMRVRRAQPPDRQAPARALAAHYLGANLHQELEAAVRTVGLRRFDALRRVRRLAGEVARVFRQVTADLDQEDTPRLDMRQFRAFVARELLALDDAGHNIVHRTEGASRETRQAVSSLVRSASSRFVKDLTDPDGDHWLRAPRTSGAEQRVSRKAAQALDEVADLWSQQHRAMSSALLLDVQVEWLHVEARRAVEGVFHRVRREIEAGPLAGMRNAVEILERIRDLRHAEDAATPARVPTDVAVDPDSTDSENDDSGSWPATGDLPAESAEFKEAYLKAADELRGTWEEPYRPAPRDLVDQLLLGLGRAADRVPESLTTLSENALELVAEGVPSRTQTTFAARRLAQNFLEKQVAQPARQALRDLPDQVAEAQSRLVDAVRLVAFDLEQQATGANVDEGEVVDAIAMSGMLTERIKRLETAQANLEQYLARLQRDFLDACLRSLADVRAAVTGTSGPLVATNAQRMGIRRAGGRVVKGAIGALRVVERGVAGTAGRLTRRQATALPLGTVGGTLADDLLDLRARLFPRPDLQASLPLIYRRIFGRAPLENVDLLYGRADQLAVLARVVERWKNGVGGPLAILGEPRSGKSTLANMVAREILGERTTVRITPPVGGMPSRDLLNEAVVEAVGGRKGQGAEIALRAMPPGAVLLIDDLGRWIERTPGGLAALELWHQLWRRLGDRHLFVLTATPYAWTYASQLLGVSESFLDMTTCHPLSQRDLSSLLALRQRTSDFELEFEGSGRTSFLSAFSRTESKQLMRLHDRSGGNIGDALSLWRRSIVRVSDRKITLSVTPAPDTSVLDRLPLRWYAALGAIVVHRAVTTPRMARLMRLSREDAVGLLSDLERAGLLMSERSGAWIVDPVLQPHVLRKLKARTVLNTR